MKNCLVTMRRTRKAEFDDRSLLKPSWNTTKVLASKGSLACRWDRVGVAPIGTAAGARLAKVVTCHMGKLLGGLE